MRQKICEYLVKNHHIDFIGRKTVTIDKIKDYPLKSFWEFGLDVIGNCLNPEEQIKFHKAYKSDGDKAKFFVEIAEAIKDYKKESQRRKFGGVEIPKSKAVVSYIPVINIKDNEKSLINPQTKEISELSYEAYIETLSKDQKEAVKEQARLAKFVYDPYDLSNLVMEEFENYELLKVNTYKPPYWRRLEPTDAACPEQIERILSHLFPSEAALEYVLDWLYHALVSRNEAYLVLNGAKGIGKGVFCSIVKALVGQENYTEAPDSLLDSQFNSALDKKRVIVMDEFKVDKSKHTKLKRYINKYQNIEKKGQDAEKSTETFNSFIISNNDESDMYLEYDDRRFSAVDLTDKNLTEVMSARELKKLHLELEKPDSELVKNFGYFIYNRGAKFYDEFAVFKGEKYHRLVESSLKLWQKYILEIIEDGLSSTFKVKDIRDTCKFKYDTAKFPYHGQKIKDFLDNYRYKGETVLGSLEKDDEGDLLITVNPEMLSGDTTKIDSL